MIEVHDLKSTSFSPLLLPGVFLGHVLRHTCSRGGASL
jgi:hypothetical protein